MKRNIDSKLALVVGSGRWGKIMIKVLLSLGFSVKYATRNLIRDYDLERKFEGQKISLLKKKFSFKFDLIILCVRPNDIFEVWEKYHSFGKSILIEKPGPISLIKLQNIIKASESINQPTLINYEYYYTQTSRDLREILRENFSNIKSIEMTWEKTFISEGGIEWRLLPHLIGELFIRPDVRIQNLNANISLKSAFLDGTLDHIPFKINVLDSKQLIHNLKITMVNGDYYYKDRDELSINGNIISRNTFSSLANILNLFESPHPNLYSENANLALFVSRNLSLIY